MNLRPRRFLPSIPQLLAFEAVMRARSTVAAASELKLTQSTVSRLVQTLEDQVGRPLFHRHRKRLIPTEAGEAYCLEVSRALNILQQASMALALNPTGEHCRWRRCRPSVHAGWRRAWAISCRGILKFL
jgi:LysR family glycine cleavage system transcriptional activator